MSASDQNTEHYNQKPRRKAEFIRPPNMLKAKVGSGGLSDEILQKAQDLLENNSVDFLPLAEMYLATLFRGIEYAKAHYSSEENEAIITNMLYPAMQLKANGGMFHYPLITSMADKLVQFLEVIIEPDTDAMEIVLAFHTTLRAVVTGKITGDGGQHGQELLKALDDACTRYFERYSNNRSDREQDFTEVF